MAATLTAMRAPADTTTPAVVLKLDDNVMHHGGLGAIRSLGRLGVPVHGVHEDLLAPAAASRYLAGRWYWRPDPDDPERITAGLTCLSERIGRRAVLIPTDDAGAIFLAEHGGSLRERFAFPDPRPGLPRQLAGKYSLFQLCREEGVACPEAAMPGSEQAAGEFAALAGFPLVAKLSAPWAGGGRVPSTSIIHGEAELAAIYAACAAAGTPLMLQEFIPGGPGDDWFFHGYRGSSGRQTAFTGVKDRSYPAHAGLTCLGRSAANPDLAGDITRLLDRLDYRGIADLDLRFDSRDGQYKLLDFNPRLGAQFRLFRDTAGTDVVTAAYLDLTGQRAPAGQQVSGRSFLVENYDPIAALSYRRSGELGLGSWLGSLRAVDETAWFARDDVRPFGLMCLRMGWRLVSRPFARRGRRAGGRELPHYRAGRGATPAQPVTDGRRGWHRPAQAMRGN